MNSRLWLHCWSDNLVISTFTQWLNLFLSFAVPTSFLVFSSKLKWQSQKHNSTVSRPSKRNSLKCLLIDPNRAGCNVKSLTTRL